MLEILVFDRVELIDPCSWPHLLGQGLVVVVHYPCLACQAANTVNIQCNDFCQKKYLMQRGTSEAILCIIL